MATVIKKRLFMGSIDKDKADLDGAWKGLGATCGKLRGHCM
jgi:hypothetical protein